MADHKLVHEHLLDGDLVRGGDEYANVAVAIGALFIALTSASGVGVDMIDTDGALHPELLVGFPFLKSPYLLTLRQLRLPENAEGPELHVFVFDGEPPDG